MIKAIKNNSTKKVNQNGLVKKYILKGKNRYRKLTTEQICIGANILGGLSGKKKLSPTQVSKCLNRFSLKGVVMISDRKGVTTRGSRCARWVYNPTA